MNKVFAVSLFSLMTILHFSFQNQPFDLKASMARGKELYSIHCISCHMEQGEGISPVFPPLAKSDYLMANKKRSIQQILYGLSGEIKVNGVTYQGEMSGFDLSNQEVSDILNYIRNSWENKGEVIKPAEVQAARINKK